MIQLTRETAKHESIQSAVSFDIPWRSFEAHLHCWPGEVCTVQHQSMQGGREGRGWRGAGWEEGVLGEVQECQLRQSCEDGTHLQDKGKRFIPTPN